MVKQKQNGFVSFIYIYIYITFYGYTWWVNSGPNFAVLLNSAQYQW